MASPGGRIDASFVAEEIRNAGIYGGGQSAGPEWIEQRLSEKLYAMREYRDGNSEPGFIYFQDAGGMRPIEWWYYH